MTMTVFTRPTIDFDHHSLRYKHDWVEMARAFLAQDQPIAWTEAWGGFWVVATWEGVNRVGEDWETFTSYNDVEGTGNGGKGQLIPQQPYRLDLGESDPPLHTERRRLEVPFFTPKAIRQWRPKVQEHLVEALNGVVSRGHCNLIDDVILPTAARTTLYMTGYGADDWRDAATAAHLAFVLQPTDEGYPAAEMARMRGKFRDMLTDRRTTPTGDLISALAHGTVDGRDLTLDEGESMMNALIFGGFDTAVATTAHALIRLERSPEYRDRIVEDEAFRKNFVEEVLRLCPPPAGMARTVVRDTEFMGQRMTKGESVFMWLAAANRDPRKFTDPDLFDPERVNARDHVSFSTGHHRCLGSPLAKVEVADILRVVCTALPDLRIDLDEVVAYPRLGGANGFSKVPATFSPRAPLTIDADGVAR
ncbi:cytochrome P450 [Pseudonocardia sp. CA-107938]|uniref:cytochrome P450 n=1 Tax=Pseudonocardia sp. CA-107938 TaxID=3240021 RepID=UPI003D8FC70A